MRVLVTGATGFLGGALARRLLADGVRVRMLARSAAAAEPLAREGAELVIGDVADATAVRKAMQDVAVVYHFAGRLFVPGVPDDEYRRTHVEGTRALLAEACKQGVARFVHCSTTGVLGVTGDQPADESATFRPTNAYEATKLEAELLVRGAMLHGFPAVIVRPGLVYGPGDLHLVGFFRSIQRGQFRPIGRRPVWLHPIYIDDMTEATVRCGADPRATGECFHIAGQRPATLTELACTIAGALGVAQPRGFIPFPAALAVAAVGDALPPSIRQAAPLTRSRLDFLTHSRVYDVRKAGRLLDFAAATPLAHGIARTADWYREQGHLAPMPARAPQEAQEKAAMTA
jgi:nucleoside-diphosphate-sugar epimerase